ncbi:unnamed protein product [Mytilus coruscus]|uniref:Uncharacterized protein n=1 Tax=Mytilus coruscus TaxID=42192 RepID=A0A6J8DT94_MYTCO|nr:unnamed protein product [Mytilus coruscus]
MDSADLENEFETPRLIAQGRPVFPRSRSFETFHDLTPTGEKSIRVNQDQWPSQVNFDRFDKDGMHQTDNRPLSRDVAPSRKVASDQAKNPEVSNRAMVVHFKKKCSANAINKWSIIEKALELATSLRGTDQSILTDLRPKMRTNFKQLTAALASRFQPENESEMYRAQMKSKIRGRTEQIYVLGQDIKRLVR